MPPGDVAVAFSGGVDSSYAAYLLKEAGWNVLAVTFVFHKGQEEAVSRAKKIATLLGVSHKVINLKKRFDELVVKPFVQEYLHSRTPNPCVRCNPLLKWNTLHSEFEGMHIATGHYARVRKSEGRFLLLRGRDRRKEQSYFLYRLTQSQLERTVFPLGEVTKSKVIREAERIFGNIFDSYHSSQDSCFLLGRGLEQVLKKYLAPGDVVDTSGKVVGKHNGAALFTIGQRRGFGSFGEPRYVVRIDTKSNRVYIGNEDELYKRRFSIVDTNWFPYEHPRENFQAVCKIRYLHPGAEAVVSRSGSKYIVNFSEPQKAITPGQSAVFYDGDKVIGGGIIDRVIE